MVYKEIQFAEKVANTFLQSKNVSVKNTYSAIACVNVQSRLMQFNFDKIFKKEEINQEDGDEEIAKALENPMDAMMTFKGLLFHEIHHIKHTLNSKKRDKLSYEVKNVLAMLEDGRIETLAVLKYDKLADYFCYAVNNVLLKNVKAMDKNLSDELIHSYILVYGRKIFLLNFSLLKIMRRKLIMTYGKDLVKKIEDCVDRYIFEQSSEKRIEIAEELAKLLADNKVNMNNGQAGFDIIIHTTKGDKASDKELDSLLDEVKKAKSITIAMQDKLEKETADIPEELQGQKQKWNDEQQKKIDEINEEIQKKIDDLPSINDEINNMPSNTPEEIVEKNTKKDAINKELQDLQEKRREIKNNSFSLKDPMDKMDNDVDETDMGDEAGDKSDNSGIGDYGEDEDGEDADTDGKSGKGGDVDGDEETDADGDDSSDGYDGDDADADLSDDADGDPTEKSADGSGGDISAPYQKREPTTALEKAMQDVQEKNEDILDNNRNEIANDLKEIGMEIDVFHDKGFTSTAQMQTFADDLKRGIDKMNNELKKGYVGGNKSGRVNIRRYINRKSISDVKIFNKYMPDRMKETKLLVNIFIDGSSSMNANNSRFVNGQYITSKTRWQYAMDAGWILNEALNKDNNKVMMYQFSTGFSKIKGYDEPLAVPEQIAQTTQPYHAILDAIPVIEAYKRKHDYINVVDVIITDGEFDDDRNVSVGQASPDDNAIARLNQLKHETIIINVGYDSQNKHNAKHKIYVDEFANLTPYLIKIFGDIKKNIIAQARGG